jgi:hypothetical protein
MRALTSETGLYLEFEEADKSVLENGGDIECRHSDYPQQRVIVHVKEKLEGFFENPHIRTRRLPKGSSAENAECYETEISLEYAKEIMEMHGGGTRCDYDRLDIVYRDGPGFFSC